MSIYMRARWYEPQSGRFLSEDPIGLAGGINPYVYAGNDPVNATDPGGLNCQLVHFVQEDSEGVREWDGKVLNGRTVRGFSATAT